MFSRALRTQAPLLAVNLFLFSLLMCQLLFVDFSPPAPLHTCPRSNCAPQVAAPTGRAALSQVTTTPREFIDQFGHDERYLRCDELYGFGLIKRLKLSRRLLCGPANKAGVNQTSVWVYSEPDFFQQHFGEETAGIDLAAVDNLKVDFRRPWGQQSPPSDGMLGSCTDFQWGNLFRFNHFFKHAFSNRDEARAPCQVWESTPTIFLWRDEIQNNWHVLTDYVNVFVVSLVADLEKFNIVILDNKSFDGSRTGKYFDALALLSDNIRFYDEFDGQVVCFQRAFINPSPFAAFFWQQRMFDRGSGRDGTLLACRGSDLMLAYIKKIVFGFGLADVLPPPAAKPVITLVSRWPVGGGWTTIGRGIDNEDEFIAALNAFGTVTARKVDFAALTYREQIRCMRETSVLVGMHGAGMTNLLFLPEEAAVVELFPFGEWLPQGYWSLCKFRNIPYFSWQSRDAANTVNKYPERRFDPKQVWTRLPIDEVVDVVDGAVRLARGYGESRGLCGLRC